MIKVEVDFEQSHVFCQVHKIDLERMSSSNNGGRIVFYVKPCPKCVEDALTEFVRAMEEK